MLHVGIIPICRLFRDLANNPSNNRVQYKPTLHPSFIPGATYECIRILFGEPGSEYVVGESLHENIERAW